MHHRPLLNLPDKIKLRRSDKYVALSNLDMYYTQKKKNNNAKTANIKYQVLHRIKNLLYLKDRNLYQIFKIILKIS